MSQDFLEKLNKAYHLVTMEQYSTALPRLNLLVNNAPNVEIYNLRAQTFVKLGKFDEALQDSDKAIALDNSRYEGFFLKGIALFNQGKFKEANSEWESAKNLLGDTDIHEAAAEQVNLWVAKSHAEIGHRKTLVDTKLAARAAKKEETVQKSAPVEEKKKEEPKPVEKPIEKPIVTETKKAETKVEPKPAAFTQPPKAVGKIGYVWKQTDNRVYIEIRYALDRKESLKVKFEDKKASIHFAIDSSRNYALELELFDEIDANTSSFSISLDKVEVVLDKKNKNKQWPTLERPDADNEVVLESKGPVPISASNASQTPMSYPSSSKTKKDWSKIDREIEEDMKANKDEYAQEDPLNKLFKELYKNADEKTRMAMNKSFQTSGGTVLSTNWDEVQGKNYEGKDRPSAPGGQEWKTWEK
jgi:suppressor of G2 allele of SKP1